MENFVKIYVQVNIISILLQEADQDLLIVPKRHCDEMSGVFENGLRIATPVAQGRYDST